MAYYTFSVVDPGFLKEVCANSVEHARNIILRLYPDVSESDIKLIETHEF